jgi:hypothetical protein
MKKQVYNPYLPLWEYIPDGEPHIYNDRLYVFGSHDRFNGTQFCMNDYVCWSCPVSDLADWKYEGYIYHKTQDPHADENSIMQAPDVCRGPDGRYYLYYTLGLSPIMSVAVCDTPSGNYEYYGDIIYSDGIPVGLKKHDIFQFDPGVFMDDDGRIWLYSGFGPKEEGFFAAACQKYQMKGAYCMELSPDMKTVISEPKMILSKEGTHGFFEASSMRKIGGKYYFIYSSQLGHELCYAIGDRPDGSFEIQGTLVSNGDVGLSEPARNYMGNTHGGLVEINEQWYIFYHRQTNRHQYSRQACAEKIRFENGRFLQAEMTSCGLNSGPLEAVGEYPASIACNLMSKEGTLFYGVSGTPEAKNHPYFTQSGDDRDENPDQYIANFRDGSICGYKYFFFNGKTSLKVLISGNGKGKLIVCMDNENNIVSIMEPVLNGQYEWIRSEPFELTGTHALYLKYEGEGYIDLHKLRFDQI